MLLQDLRYAWRSLMARPGFAAVAVLSLALGIGANTAIFSLWNQVRFASLPGVDAPDALVMLTNPDASGLWRGTWNTTSDGPRSWVSFAEFEQLREQSPAFSALMASQSSLNDWQVRVEGGPPEEARGRLVSGGFFNVLGVRPTIGQLFTNREDEGDPSVAVISHAYWQRRFGGRPDALGRVLTIRDASVTIVGVAAPGFAGETTGQLPDLWLPLRLQPRLIPGSDWLREQPPEKVMWLHVFGRLAPGVTGAQADAQANAVLQAGLESFYGGVSGDRRRELLDQHLRLSSGARGAYAGVSGFSSSLTVLLAAVGVLLLIACANLANLLLARGAARRGEMALRAAFGASRARLMRQVVTESATLAAVGGLAAILVASAMHGALVRMLQQAEPRFVLDFALDPRVLVFAVAAAAASALAMGLVPAVQMSRRDGATDLRDAGRGTIGSHREARSGRWLAALQLALSVPLLVGAGLLVRTAQNLEHPDLGFAPDRLLLARVNLGEIAADVARFNRALREIHARVEAIPGVEAATFSQLGLFSGGMSTVGIRVEGSALTAAQARLSALDRVGARYFTTLGIPIRRGRDISEGDTAGSPNVCVINEAFARQYFAGRDPLGLHVVTAADDGEGTAYQIVGVVADARTQVPLRNEADPRFFVAAEQRPSSSGTRTFLIRTRSSEPAVAEALRDLVAGVEPAASVSGITWFDGQLAELTAEDRAVARLAVVFGTVALTLAAIGLYGVLSYGVARRAGEIAIRIALGAQGRGVIAMILRESLGFVAVGLVVGTILAFAAARLLAGRLYGVSQLDPLTITTALAVLVTVAFTAAYLPARRASRVDPVAALHQA